MSLPTVLAIDPNRETIKNIVKHLQQLGFTVLEDPHHASQEKYSGFIEIMGIIFPEDLAGLVLETFGNLPLSDKTTFYVICHEQNGHEFDYYGPEEKLYKIYSNTPLTEQINVFLQSIPFPEPQRLMGNYVTEAYLDISEIKPSKLMQHYFNQLFTGYVIFDWEKERTIFQLKKGKISNIISSEPIIIDNIHDLDIFKKGKIRVERYFPTKVDLILEIKEEGKTGKDQSSFSLALTDVLTDAFYYLILYLARFFDKFQIKAQFQTALIEFNNSLGEKELKIDLVLEEETIFTFDPPIDENNLDSYIEFLRYFFFKMEQIHPEVKLTELLTFYEEIKPYLESIHFYEKFLQRKNNDNSYKTNKLIPT